MSSSSNPFPNSLVQETVFHGTNVPNITEFNTRGEQSNGAIFFASDGEEAELHGSNKSGEQYMYEVKLDIRNPMRVTNMYEWGDPSFEGKAIRQAKRQGYDSVIFDNGFDGEEHSEFYAVFDPKQVKIQNRRKI